MTRTVPTMLTLWVVGLSLACRPAPPQPYTPGWAESWPPEVDALPYDLPTIAFGTPVLRATRRDGAWEVRSESKACPPDLPITWTISDSDPDSGAAFAQAATCWARPTLVLVDLYSAPAWPMWDLVRRLPARVDVALAVRVHGEPRDVPLPGPIPDAWWQGSVQDLAEAVAAAHEPPPPVEPERTEPPVTLSFFDRAPMVTDGRAPTRVIQLERDALVYPVGPELAVFSSAMADAPSGSVPWGRSVEVLQVPRDPPVARDGRWGLWIQVKTASGAIGWVFSAQVTAAGGPDHTWSFDEEDRPALHVRGADGLRTRVPLRSGQRGGTLQTVEGGYRSRAPDGILEAAYCDRSERCVTLIVERQGATWTLRSHPELPGEPYWPNPEGRPAACSGEPTPMGPPPPMDPIPVWFPTYLRGPEEGTVCKAVATITAGARTGAVVWTCPTSQGSHDPARSRLTLHRYAQDRDGWVYLPCASDPDRDADHTQVNWGLGAKGAWIGQDPDIVWQSTPPTFTFEGWSATLSARRPVGPALAPHGEIPGVGSVFRWESNTPGEGALVAVDVDGEALYTWAPPPLTLPDFPGKTWDGNPGACAASEGQYVAWENVVDPADLLPLRTDAGAPAWSLPAAHPRHRAYARLRKGSGPAPDWVFVRDPMGALVGLSRTDLPKDESCFH